MQSKLKYTLILLLLFATITGAVSIRRSLKGSNDFDTFYNAGRAVLTQQGVYYTGEYYQEDAAQSPFLYPPFAACLFALLAWLPMPPAAFLWNFLNIIFFISCAWFILRITESKTQDLQSRWRTLSWLDRFLILGITLSLCLDNLLMAQANILVFFFALWGLFLIHKKRPLLGGIVLAASIMIKMTPALFIFYLIAKKNGKALIGVVLGMLLFTAVVPTGILGPETSRLYHRQWLGRTVKPMLGRTTAIFPREEAHPNKKSSDLVAHAHMSSLLLDKNQSMPGMLTRLFLKNRKAYGHAGEPIYAARRYEKLPVLIPIPRPVLSVLILLAQILMVGVLFDLARRKRSEYSGFLEAFQIALFFIAMPLLSPLARSHQFVGWFVAYFLYLLIKGKESHASLQKLSWGIRLSALLYFLQSLPYGKAAGLGALSGLCLWVTLVLYLYKTYFNKTSSIHASA